MISQLRCGCGRFQLIRSVLIYGMCLFEEGIGVARRRPQRAPSLTVSTSEQTSRNHFRLRTSGTAFSRFVLQTSRMPFVACNELAIATKSIASVCPHAERTPWVPFQGGTAVWAALSNTSSECVVAKANEADCGAQTPKWKSPEGKEGANLI